MNISWERPADDQKVISTMLDHQRVLRNTAGCWRWKMENELLLFVVFPRRLMKFEISLRHFHLLRRALQKFLVFFKSPRRVFKLCVHYYHRQRKCWNVFWFTVNNVFVWSRLVCGSENIRVVKAIIYLQSLKVQWEILVLWVFDSCQRFSQPATDCRIFNSFFEIIVLNLSPNPHKLPKSLFTLKKPLTHSTSHKNSIKKIPQKSFFQ